MRTKNQRIKIVRKAFKELRDISLCKNCNCMTHTIKDKSEIFRCSKCGNKKL